MLNDDVLVFDSAIRAEKQVQKIILSILDDAGLKPDGNELSRGLPDYFCRLFNHQIIDYYCVRYCTSKELTISANYKQLKSRVREKVKSDILKHIYPAIEFCQTA